ncbi:MAG: hypothetical protein ACI90V_000371 [Bacillariaceae sp.]|jgi:hypothetical protein
MVSGRRTSSGTGGTHGPLPPISSKAKDYSQRPDEVVDELDDLRTRGIAKVLNKHFTQTTKQLAMEKAQADSALADLERRRAQTKTFVPSKGGDLNPYDQLYVQLQQKRAECRRKEKETLMLYQRYVMKYGKSAKAAPLVDAAAQAASSSSKQQHSQKNGGGGGGGKEDSIMSNSSDHHKQGDPPGKSALGTLDENSEINFSKFYEKQRVKQQQEKKSKEESEENVVHFMSALNKFMTVSDEDEQEQNDTANKSDDDAGVPQLVPTPSKDGSHLTDSPVSAQVNTFNSAISNFTAATTLSDADNKEKEESEEDDDIQSDIAIRIAEDANIIEPDTDDNNDNEQVEDTTKANKIISSDTAAHIEEHKDEDLSSPRKSQTSKTELDNVTGNRGSLTQEKENDDDIAPPTPDIIPEAAATIVSPSSRENPCFATTTVEGYDADDRSIISELTTANSAVTRQLLDEVETEMEDFIKNEMEAIRMMLDSEEDSSTINHSVFGDHQSETSSSLMAGDESVHVAMKAEAMALEMQKILDDFAKEDAASVSVHDESAQSDKNETATMSVYPYKFEPALTGEEWYVHFDETYQKEFYVEKISKRTQWDYPSKSLTPRVEQQTPISSDEFLSDMHSVASSRRSLSRKSSRRSLYRKQRKKRRKRRLMMSSVALICVLVTVFYWRIHHPNETVLSGMAAFVVSLKNIDIAETKVYIINQVEQTKIRVIDQIEYLTTDRKAREEEHAEAEEATRIQTHARAEKDRKARELAAAQKAKEEEEIAKRIASEEAARRLAREEAERLIEIEKKMKQDEDAMKLEKDAEIEQKRSKKDRMGRRPWGCNIPLAYVVPYCFRLSNTYPIYTESDLVFLQ